MHSVPFRNAHPKNWTSGNLFPLPRHFLQLITVHALDPLPQPPPSFGHLRALTRACNTRSDPASGQGFRTRFGKLSWPRTIARRRTMMCEWKRVGRGNLLYTGELFRWAAKSAHAVLGELAQ